MVAGERNDAQSLAQIRELASRLASKNGDAAISSVLEPKSPKPDKPRTGGNGSKSELNPGELVRLQKNGSECISDTEGKIARAQTVEDLMALVDSVPSKGASKKRLSLKLPNGLPALLPVDKDFSKNFNTLIDQWEKRIAEVFFDDAHREYFRDSLREALKTDPKMPKGDFFSQYLEHFDCSALGDVVSVREKLVALWKEQFPSVMRELKNQTRQEEKFIVGEEYVLRKDPSKEYVITEISGDKIAYKSLEGGLVSYSTKEQFARFLKKKSSKRTDRPKISMSTQVGNPGDQSPLPDAVMPNPDIASVREYKELFAMADESGDGDILMGAIKKGVVAMRKGAKAENIDLTVYHREHPGEVATALIDGMQEAFEDVRGGLKWSEVERDTFARGFVHAYIEKTLK